MSDPQRSGDFDGLSPSSIAPWHRSRRGASRGTAHGGAESAACQALARLYADHYGSIVRLAALLTGDADCADDVAVDSFVALCSAGFVKVGDRAVSYLRRQVVIRSRQATRRVRTGDYAEPQAAGTGPGHSDCPDCSGGQSAAGGFGSLPVVLGLMTLGRAEREAVVLTRYLDLSERQAAAAAGVSEAALRRDLANATEVLRGWLAGSGASPRRDPRPP
jgi:DNA-directed RNA polymerase specialized sigma24 family protein